MAKENEKHYVRHAQFLDAHVCLSPAIIYQACEFGRCKIFIGDGDMIPEMCHIEQCTIVLRPDVTFEGFLSTIAKSGGDVWADALVFQFLGSQYTQSVWGNCKVLVDVVERSMYEMTKELYDKRMSERVAQVKST